ncbi:adenylosuccinate synthase [Rubinisphaera italica]|uniref:Adenylosuccinate synthetase n=1 Tax=Rubinisphaera italica TaxID=2527969 RepID=A0A5C5XLK8_9PLAN|nr:adenylosuccinate synthase [Rubinisphaera italica]TWT63283.1 Adenylosuccinate synthetase [Rubinisphaera italica]
MSATAVVGLQWGDEAKGKIVDLLTDQHEIVVRYLGGNNAGHTVKFDGKTFKLSLLPAGVLRPGVTSVIANGVVINPEALLKEIAGVESQGVEIGEDLLISDRAHVIFPYHMAEEIIYEKLRGEDAIGTTMRGIGYCYREKAGRTHAIRVGDLIRPDVLKQKLPEIVAFKNQLLSALDPEHVAFQAKELIDQYVDLGKKLEKHITDTTAYLHHQIKAGRRLLFEGAQGSLLDIDHGTFPFVTSSNSSGAGIHSGSGVPERHISRMIGIVKAYTTRVGGGPCPTELKDETGQHIRDEGNEYGTVTGRPRRCGWLDAVATKYGAEVSGVDCLAVMLLDVLSKLPELKICEAYEINGKRTETFPSQIDDLAAAKPIYRTLKGWQSDICGVRSMSDLPPEAMEYVKVVSDMVGVPVEIVSVGPDREQTILE